MAALYALKAVRDSGLPLSRKVRVIFGTDEESENADISHYLKRERPPSTGFTPDAFFPLVYAEKGIITLDLVKDTVRSPPSMNIERIHGGVAANMVPDLAEADISTKNPDALIEACEGFAAKTEMNLRAERKGYLVTVKSLGLAAHGSKPEEGKNAVMQLLAFLGTLPLKPSDIFDAISFLNDAVGMETDGRSFGLAMEDEPSGKLSLNLGTVRTTNKMISFTINMRYPVTFEQDDVMVPFRDRISGFGFQIENRRGQKPLYFPKDSPLVETLLRVFKENTGYEGNPLAIGGGTYAKEMPNILAFGPIFPGEPMVEHKPDEYIKVDELLLNCKIYAHAIYELAK